MYDLLYISYINRILNLVPSNMGQPSASKINSTSITVSWLPPARPNGIIIYYTLYIFTNSVTMLYNGTSLSYVCENLAPGTSYSFSVYAATLAGRAISPSLFTKTDDAIPLQFQAPVVSQIQSTSATISWAAPSIPNGIIFTYQVLINGTLVSNTLSFTITVISLQVFTPYNVTLSACNQAGCASASSTFWTLSAG